MSAGTNEGIEPTKTSPQDEEMQKYYQEYLQKCCEAGQISYNLGQLESQRLEMEKNLEVTERAVKTAANKHRELQREKFSKMKPKEEEVPKLEMKQEASH